MVIDSLLELKTGLCGADVWKEMYEVAVFAASTMGTDARGLKPKPVSPQLPFSPKRTGQSPMT